MKLSQTPLLLGGLVLATLLIACGGGAAEKPGTLEATPTASEGDAAAAMAELTVEDLAALVLQQSNYGLMAFGMEISDESGPSDNEKAARDFETLEVTAAELDQLGRLGGYILSFEDLAFEKGRPLQVGSWVELFDASGDLGAYLDLNIQDIRATKDVDGLKVIELNEVDIPKVEGATAWHAVMELPGSEVPFNWSFGFVQRGRLLAGAQVVEFGVTDRPDEMAGVLYQLVTRLDGALAGTLEVSVDHVLPVTTDDRRVPAPTGGPDLAAMGPARGRLWAGLGGRRGRVLRRSQPTGTVPADVQISWGRHGGGRNVGGQPRRFGTTVVAEPRAGDRVHRISAHAVRRCGRRRELRAADRRRRRAHGDPSGHLAGDAASGRPSADTNDYRQLGLAREPVNDLHLDPSGRPGQSDHDPRDDDTSARGAARAR